MKALVTGTAGFIVSHVAECLIPDGIDVVALDDLVVVCETTSPPGANWVQGFVTDANKYLDTIIHTFLSTLHLLPRAYDVVLIFIVGNSLVSFIPRLGGKKVVLNVDGLDWRRQKWPLWAKKYIQFAEYLATKLPNEMVTDSGVIAGERGAESLREQLQAPLNDLQMVEEYREKAMQRAEKHYSWEKVTDDYENLFRRLLEG